MLVQKGVNLSRSTRNVEKIVKQLTGWAKKTSVVNDVLLCLERDIVHSELLYEFTFLASLLAPWLRQTDASNFSRELPTYESFFLVYVDLWSGTSDSRCTVLLETHVRECILHAFVHSAFSTPMIVVTIVIERMRSIFGKIVEEKHSWISTILKNHFLPLMIWKKK